MLEFCDIHAGYRGNPVLRGLTFRLSVGELAVLLGVNGSGKSTALSLVTGRGRCRSGSILLDGRRLGEYSCRERARLVACLNQKPSSGSLSVLDTVLLGRYPHLAFPYRYAKRDYAIAENALARMGLESFADRPVSTLSGGEARRVELARALAQESRYLLLDEPTAALDIAHAHRLLSECRALAREGRGVLAVLHDLPLAMTYADRIIVLDSGVAIYDGDKEGFLAQKLTERVFGVSSRCARADFLPMV